jgi:hypothetical protein
MTHAKLTSGRILSMAAQVIREYSGRIPIGMMRTLSAEELDSLAWGVAILHTSRQPAPLKRPNPVHRGRKARTA